MQQDLFDSPPIKQNNQQSKSSKRSENSTVSLSPNPSSQSNSTTSSKMESAQEQACAKNVTDQELVVAYTDGACKNNPGVGGWGVWITWPNGTQQALCGGEAHTTNNRMELQATIEVLKATDEDTPLQLWTDSSYVKNGITQWIHGWKKNGWRTASKKAVKNDDLWRKLDELRQNREIDWRWVKGHAGIEGNEKADELANKGVDKILAK